MHEQRFDDDERALRPKAAAAEDHAGDRAGRAAAEGRSDVLGAEGLLGLQRSAGNAGVTAMLEEERSPVHDVVASGGHPLGADVRADMEARLGHDFGQVRVHDDAAAHSSAKAMNANAYTVGSNIVFQRDHYDLPPHGRAAAVALGAEQVATRELLMRMAGPRGQRVRRRALSRTG